MKKKLFKHLQIVFLLAGLVLFAYLVKRTGLGTLAHYLQRLGWGFAAVIAISGLRNYVRAAALYFAIDPSRRLVNFFTLTNVMLAGESIKHLTATGPFLSEPAKAAMVRRHIPLLEGVSPIAIENLIYYLSVFLFMMSGLPIFGWLTDVPRALKVSGFLTVTVMFAGIIVTYFSVRRRGYLIARALEWLSKRLKKNFASAITQVRAVETNIYDFYEKRQGAFYLIFALNLFAHLLNVVEVYVILLLMELDATIAASFVIEAVTKVINFVFFFVPSRAGVYESGNALVLGALGLGASAGVALAIIRQLRALTWVTYGLAVIALITFKDRRSATNGREEVKG